MLRASVALFRGFDEVAWLRRGTASENEVSVRALAYMIAGHAQYHAKLFEEQYFPAIPRAQARFARRGRVANRFFRYSVGATGGTAAFLSRAIWPVW